MARFVILTEGRTNPSDAKTANNMIRYRGGEVAGLIDSTRAGKTAGEVLGIGGAIPIVASLSEIDGDTLLIGIAPAGGGLPPEWRPTIRAAIERGMNIVSGLHILLGDDPEFAALAEARGVTIRDLRRVPDDIPVSSNRAKDARCRRVLTVGTDCNVGKMVTGLELARALERRGLRSRFIATGQTGILLAEHGIAVDRTISDFTAGAAEQLVLGNQDQDVIVIEGQGSITHPLYSGVTLSLLHGSAPDDLILCYDLGRDRIRHTEVPLLPLRETIELYESLARVIHPAKVVGLSVNTCALSEPRARREVEESEAELGLPVTDVIRFGTVKLEEAVLRGLHAARRPD